MMGKTTRERIIEVLASHPYLYTSDIVRRVQSTEKYIRRLLNDMEARGQVQSAYRRLRLPLGRNVIVRVWWLTPRGFELLKKKK